MLYYYTKVMLWVILSNIDTDYAEKKKKLDDIIRKKKQEAKKHIFFNDLINCGGTGSI